MRQLALCSLAFPLLMFAAKNDKNERSWKTAKVISDSSISSDSTEEAAKLRPAADDRQILVVQDGDDIYTVQEKHAWHGWCLLIQGEEIKYAQDDRKLYVVDSDGQKCQLDILSRKKSPSP